MKKNNGFILLFGCCWLTYLTAYLCRVNFSSAMHTISGELMFTEERLGIIGAVFYVVYAIGQLVNGYIGDRVRPDRYVRLALAGTLICNLGMAFAGSFPMMIIVWGLNGCFQSMFWSTIIRVLAQNIGPEKRALVSMGISIAMPAAYMVSWGLLGQCLEGAAAQWYFLAPAIVCVPLICVWTLFSKKYNFSREQGGATIGVHETAAFIISEKLHWMLIVCMLHGLIKEGVGYWLPLLLAEGTGIDSVSPYLMVTILPFANLVGIIASKVMLGRAKNPFGVLAAVFAAIAAISFGLILKHDGMFMIGLMALISGLAYANNTILMSYIPMQYTSKNMVASIIGVFDFASYVGAACSTYVLGRVLAHAGFDPLPGIWLGAAVAALIIAALVVTTKRSESMKTEAKA